MGFYTYIYIYIYIYMCVCVCVCVCVCMGVCVCVFVLKYILSLSFVLFSQGVAPVTAVSYVNQYKLRVFAKQIMHARTEYFILPSFYSSCPCVFCSKSISVIYKSKRYNCCDISFSRVTVSSI